MGQVFLPTSNSLFLNRHGTYPRISLEVRVIPEWNWAWAWLVFQHTNLTLMFGLVWLGYKLYSYSENLVSRFRQILPLCRCCRLMHQIMCSALSTFFPRTALTHHSQIDKIWITFYFFVHFLLQVAPTTVISRVAVVTISFLTVFFWDPEHHHHKPQIHLAHLVHRYSQNCWKRFSLKIAFLNTDIIKSHYIQDIHISLKDHSFQIK